MKVVSRITGWNLSRPPAASDLRLGTDNGLVRSPGSNGVLDGRAGVRLAFVWAGVVVLMLLTLLASRALDEPVGYFTREPQLALNGKWYAGSISNVGALLWCIGATAALLAWRVVAWRDWRSPLLHAGVLLALIGADDFFLLHDVLYDKVIEEEILWGVYFLLLAAYAYVHRAYLRREGVLGLIPLTLVCFTLSAGIDQQDFEDQLFEDGIKLLGIAAVCLMAVQLALSALSRDRRSPL